MDKQHAGNILFQNLSYQQGPMAREHTLKREYPRSSLVCLKSSKNKWAVLGFPSRVGAVKEYLWCCQFLKGEINKKAMCLKSKGRGSIERELSMFGFVSWLCCTLPETNHLNLGSLFLKIIDVISCPLCSLYVC